jgi:hypothetical protein
MAGRWWHTPLIPALRRQRQVDFWVWGQPGLQSEFQDSQNYTEKPCLEKPKKKKKKTYKWIKWVGLHIWNSIAVFLMSAYVTPCICISFMMLGLWMAGWGLCLPFLKPRTPSDCPVILKLDTTSKNHSRSFLSVPARCLLARQVYLGSYQFSGLTSSSQGNYSNCIQPLKLWALFLIPAS